MRKKKKLSEVFGVPTVVTKVYCMNGYTEGLEIWLDLVHLRKYKVEFNHPGGICHIYKYLNSDNKVIGDFWVFVNPDTGHTEPVAVSVLKMTYSEIDKHILCPMKTALRKNKIDSLLAIMN